jgi:WhiB family redox-sensing transcriptional regulator
MMTTTEQQTWAAAAKCRGMGDALFPEGTDVKRMRQFCRNCPVQIDCLAEALDNRIEWGVWGGASERERRSILRRQPDVTSWKAELSVPMAR